MGTASILPHGWHGYTPLNTLPMKQHRRAVPNPFLGPATFLLLSVAGHPSD